MIKAVIIDDEKKSREALALLIERYCPNVNIAAQADGYLMGMDVIKSNKPDLVFLDIQMPDGSGFKLLEDIGNIDFEVIFTTAFDQYAIKAIKYSALDYLLKPIIPEDLISAVEKAGKKQNGDDASANINFLIENFKNQNTDFKKIVLATIKGSYMVEVKNIIRCESDDYYTTFYLTNGEEVLVSKTIKAIEELLEDYNFLRLHRSHLVNIIHIRSYNKRVDGGTVIMKDGTEIPVSRRKKDILDNLTNLK
jgi:two-component system, LytTR family, response regulator